MSDSDLSEWMQCLNECSERTKREMEARIVKFKKLAGKPPGD